MNPGVSLVTITLLSTGKSPLYAVKKLEVTRHEGPISKTPNPHVGSLSAQPVSYRV